MKPKFVKRLNKNHFAVLVLLILVLVFIASTATRYIHAFQVDGQWAEFNSQNYMNGENNPDGFRLEYPTAWISGAFEDGGQKNLKNLRAKFSEPYFIFHKTPIFRFGGDELMRLGRLKMYEIGT